MTTNGRDERARGLGPRRYDQGTGAGPVREAAARWVVAGHRHLTLLLSALAEDGAATSRAASLRRDSERVLALFEETERLAVQTLAAERERDRLRRHVILLRDQLDRMQQEREGVADELTVAVNAVLLRRRLLRVVAPLSSTRSA